MELVEGHQADLSGQSRLSAAKGTAEQQLIISSMMLLPVDAAGILIQEPGGEVYASVTCGEHAHVLERVQVEAGTGPCLQACWTGQAVVVEDLATEMHRWPVFAEQAVKYGYRSVCSLPLRYQGDKIGALNLFRTDAGELSRFNLMLGQALADVAAIGIVQERVRARTELVNQQLQTALDTRVIIEQAKGILAERGSMDMTQAFALLRSHARRTRQRLSDLARAVVDGADTTEIFDQKRAIHRGPRLRQKVSSRG